MENSKSAIRVVGEISLQEVSGPIEAVYCAILVMGPTGSGKSSFTESFQGPDQDLRLSKNQLEGHTQKVTCYRVVSVDFEGVPLYLVDTPGFADSKISENEIIKMVRALGYLSDDVLYFTPINETRLPGTKRRTIEMLTTMLKTGVDDARTGPYEHLTFVTTFWNVLHDERTLKRGEDNFTELKDKYFKPFIDQGARIGRFENTRESALSLLQGMSNQFGPIWQNDTWPLYRDLLERLRSCLQRKQILESELSSAQLESPPNAELDTLLRKDLYENKQTLIKFIREFVSFKDPPANYADVAAELRLQIPDSIINSPELEETSSAAQDFKSLGLDHSPDSSEDEEYDCDSLEAGPASVAVDSESANLETPEHSTPPIYFNVNTPHLPADGPVDSAERQVQSESQHNEHRVDGASLSTLISPPIANPAPPPPPAPEHQDTILLAQSIQPSRASTPVTVMPVGRISRRQVLKKFPRRFLDSSKRLLDKCIAAVKR